MKRDKAGRDGQCAFVRSRLISVAEGSLPDAERAALEGHLVSCPECASLVRLFSGAWANPAAPRGPEPSPGFLAGLIGRIEAEEDRCSVRPGVLALVRKALRPAAVAALFAAGIFAGHEMARKPAAASPPEAAFADRLLQSFENIPPGSAADFYVSRPVSGKEGRQ